MRLLFCILIVSTWLPCCHAARPTVPDRQHQEECLSQFASDEIESAIEAEGEGEEFLHCSQDLLVAISRGTDFHVALNSAPTIVVSVDSRGCRPPPIG